MQTSSLQRCQLAVFSSSQGNAYMWVIFCSSEVHIYQGKLPLCLIILTMEFTFLRLKFTLIQKSTHTIPSLSLSSDSPFGELHNTDFVSPLHVQTCTLLLKWRMLQILVVNIHPSVIWASRGQFSGCSGNTVTISVTPSNCLDLQIWIPNSNSIENNWNICNF